MGKTLREEIALFMRRLYERGLTTTSGGNLSARLSPRSILVTPTGTDKGILTADQIVEVSVETGEYTHPGGLRPTMEEKWHRAVYAAFPAVGAVVHAHPPTVSAFAAMNRVVDTSILSEPYLIMGAPALVPYSAPGGESLAKDVISGLHISSVVIMANHGVTAVGKNLRQAFDRLEVLEFTARSEFISSMMGGAKKLSKDQLDELDLLGASMGFR